MTDNIQEKNIKIYQENEEIFIQGKYLIEQVVVNIEEDLSYMNSQYIKEIKNQTKDLSDNICSIKLTRLKTTETLLNLVREDPYERRCILNFASAKHPGGGYIKGSSAQEEDLCRSSFLYETLYHQIEYYNNNKNCKTQLYTDGAIYSSDVVFHRDQDYNLLDKPIATDVITIPAPNLNNLKENIYSDIICKTLETRISKIFELAKQANVKNLILGAWGCGVFKNDPKQIAKIFLDTISKPEYKFFFKKIIFPIWERDNEQKNYEVFREIFQTKKRN